MRALLACLALTFLAAQAAAAADLSDLQTVHREMRGPGTEYVSQEGWTPAVDGRGDCKGWALWGYQRLAEAGWDLRDLRVYVVDDPYSSQRHAVFCAWTDSGEWCADRQEATITPLSAYAHKVRVR